jgi:required for meiotic nuclear division protein 1
METIQVRAFSLGSEIPLEAVARHFGIARRSRWEDFLALSVDNLSGILQEPSGKTVHLFPFGCVATFGMAHHEVVDLVAYLRRIEPRLQDPQEPYLDDCLLEIGTASLEIRDDRVGVPELHDWTLGILSTVLSKSVALERVEVDLVGLIDEAEPVVQNLASGTITPSDTKISRLAGRILSFRIDTVAYIQLLDKPDAAWDNLEAEEMYGRLAQFFELNDRYDKIQAKSGILMELTEVVTTYAHHHRGMRLEWAIILLIVFEILISLFEIIVLRHV